MERHLTIGDRKISVNDRMITIDGLKFTPAEADKITGLLGFAGSMSELKALPQQIEDTPFIIEFSELGDLRLSREDTEQNIEFSFSQTDELIDVVRSAVDISVDVQRMQPSVVPRGAIGPEAADWFDGKA